MVFDGEGKVEERRTGCCVHTFRYGLVEREWKVKGVVMGLRFVDQERREGARE